MRFSGAALFALAMAAMVAGAAYGQPAPPPAERDLTVANHSPRAINEIYVSPSTVDHWGDDRLGDDTLLPGRSTHVKLGRGRDCLFDVQAVFEDASREEQHGVDVCKQRQIAFDGTGAVKPAPAEPNHDVTVANRGQRPIQQVLVSPSAAGDWGDDLLANRSISVGDSATLHYQGDCVADLRVVYDNRSAEERRDIDLCAAKRIAIKPGWTTADSVPTEAQPGAEAVLLTVTNRTGHAASRLYLVPAGNAERGPDLLGSTALDDGGQVKIGWQRPPGACVFTARIAFGAKLPEQTVAGLDLCRSLQLVLPRRG